MSKSKIYDECKTKCTTPVLSKKELCKPKKPLPKPKAHSEPVIDLPHFIRILGPKHFSIFRNFISSLAIYTVSFAILGIYITDFKTVLQYLPYYNGKYPKPQEQTKPQPVEEPAEGEATGEK